MTLDLCPSKIYREPKLVAVNVVAVNVVRSTWSDRRRPIDVVSLRRSMKSFWKRIHIDDRDGSKHQRDPWEPLGRLPMPHRTRGSRRRINE